jgi:rhodanese-related sulfurtransferase
MNILRSTLYLLAALGLLPVAHATTPLTPPDLPGVTVVTAAQARDLMAKGVLIVDTRVATEYVELHIKGAVSIPYKEKSAKSPDFDPKLDRFDLSKLPSDKNTPIIFYCNAGECWKSYKASKTALKAGYTKVYWLRGGIPEWKNNGLPVE